MSKVELTKKKMCHCQALRDKVKELTLKLAAKNDKQIKKIA